jgi:hypothetical protein
MTYGLRFYGNDTITRYFLGIGGKNLTLTLTRYLELGQGYVFVPKFTKRHVQINETRKSVPLHAMDALGARGGIASTHSRPRH